MACSALSVTVLSEPEAGGVDIDEIYWIGSAYYYHLAFVERDWSQPDWGLLPARENPPLAKYAIGLGLALAGREVASIDTLASFYTRFEATPGGWGSGTDHAKRARVVSRADPDLRRKLRAGLLELDPGLRLQARRVMVVCAVLTSLLMLLFGASVYGWPAGLLASQLLLAHPIVAYAYGHAMSDAVALLLATATALLGPLLLRRLWRPGRVRPLTAMLVPLLGAVLLGLACSAKMSSLVVVFPLGIGGLVVAARTWRRGNRPGAAGVVTVGLGIGVVGLAVFVAVNPAIHRDLAGGLTAVFQEHRLTEVVQAGFLAGHLTTPAEKLDSVATLVCFSWIGCGLLAAVAVAGLNSRRDEIRFVAVWWLFALVAVAVWIPFSWQRYALPVVAPSVLLVAWVASQTRPLLVALHRRLTATVPATSAPAA